VLLQYLLSSAGLPALGRLPGQVGRQQALGGVQHKDLDGGQAGSLQKALKGSACGGQSLSSSTAADRKPHHAFCVAQGQEEVG